MKKRLPRFILILFVLTLVGNQLDEVALSDLALASRV